MRVLIAEDDAVSRLLLQRSVEKFGHEVLVAADGEEAWRLYLHNPDVDVIISDWMMPGVDGLELCRRARGLKRTGYTYFVFLSALGDREHLLEGVQSGADDYLTKPLDRDELQVCLIAAARVTALHQRIAAQHRELEQLNAELFEQARRDPLTGLGNRLLLNEDLHTITAQAKRYGRGYCAILFDVDLFKDYNDLYGHLAGDEVLKRIADTATENFRQADSVYRYGGEEFLALLPDQSVEPAVVAAERLRQRVEDLAIPHEAKGPRGIVTVSLGVAELRPGDEKSAETLLKEADEALYRAKKNGRNTVAVHAQAT